MIPASPWPDPVPREPPCIRWIRRLVWVYLYLWIFEGVLRKWVVPSLSAPLLVVRDPVAIGIIVLALRQGLRLPRVFLVFFLTVTFMLALLGFLQIVGGTGVRLDVVIFGIRADLLHVPVIFIIGAVLDHEDVRVIGRHLLWMSIPMALLMALQFRAPIDAAINTVAGGQGLQIDSANGHIRTPGTFSFISGALSFFTLVLAFILDNGLRRIRVNAILTQGAMLATILGAVLSGSRSFIISLLGVVGALGLGIIVKPRSLTRLYKTLIWGGVAVLTMSSAAIWRDGIDTMLARVTSSGTFANGGEQTIGRITGTFSGAFTQMWSVGLLGQGLGLGTMVGGQLQTGASGIYLLAEDEWLRIVLECGPIIGMVYIALRIWIAAYLLKKSLREARYGNMLPLLIFGAAVLAILVGQWGQTSTQGYAALAGGLCLAATRMRMPIEDDLPFGAEFDGSDAEYGPAGEAAEPVPEGEG